jgi:RimJ/RimL family protein N-acetyltransferase
MEIERAPIPEVKAPEGITIRYTVPQDAEWLKKWLIDPSVKNAFPMASESEVDDAVRRWISFSRLRSSLTVEMDKRPIGISTLYLQIYRRLVHQAEFGLIVDNEFRGKGFGSFLLSSIMKLAKAQFHVELIHLQVYEGNRAVKLYERFGFKEFGRQRQWIKDDHQYVGRIFMERNI